jgi:Dyp-type peroxidase family
LGAKFVGRWRSGAPLVLSSENDNEELAEANDFEFRHSDPNGLKCPVGAHIRRANPRNSLGSNEAEAMNSIKRHRLLRRGRSYGPRATDRMIDDGHERGLLFIAVNADIERQFEFVQQTWTDNAGFGGLQGERDPLIASQPLDMSVPGEPIRRRYCGLPSFTTLRGGAYFFMPGMRALRYLANMRQPGETT